MHHFRCVRGCVQLLAAGRTGSLCPGPCRLALSILARCPDGPVWLFALVHSFSLLSPPPGAGDWAQSPLPVTLGEHRGLGQLLPLSRDTRHMPHPPPGLSHQGAGTGQPLAHRCSVNVRGPSLEAGGCPRGPSPARPVGRREPLGVLGHQRRCPSPPGLQAIALGVRGQRGRARPYVSVCPPSEATLPAVPDTRSAAEHVLPSRPVVSSGAGSWQVGVSVTGDSGEPWAGPGHGFSDGPPCAQPGVGGRCGVCQGGGAQEHPGVERGAAACTRTPEGGERQDGRPCGNSVHERRPSVPHKC